MSNLPKISTQALWGVIELSETLKKEPDALKNGDHEYPVEFVTLMETLVKAAPKPEKVEATALTLEEELRTLRTELDDFRDIAKNSEDEALMGSYLRLRTSILQKMLEFQERMYNISQMKQFEEKALNAIEQLMTPDQRTKLVEILND